MVQQPELLKMSELARRSGVPASTIKHYIREELIPPAARRTSRNMAWYDARLIPRIRTIKAIQNTRYLPLKVIKKVLDEAGDLQDPAALGVARALDRLSTNEVRSRDELLSRGVDEAELNWLIRSEVLAPREDGTFTSDDLQIVETLIQARQEGLEPEIIPAEVLVGYGEALRQLVRFEWQVLHEGLAKAPPEEVTRLAEVAATLSERLLVLMRRKMLLPTLREMAASFATDTPPSSDSEDS